MSDEVSTKTTAAERVCPQNHYFCDSCASKPTEQYEVIVAGGPIGSNKLYCCVDHYLNLKKTDQV